MQSIYFENSTVNYIFIRTLQTSQVQAQEQQHQRRPDGLRFAVDGRRGGHRVVFVGHAVILDAALGVLRLKVFLVCQECRRGRFIDGRFITGGGGHRTTHWGGGRQAGKQQSIPPGEREGK